MAIRAKVKRSSPKRRTVTLRSPSKHHPGHNSGHGSGHTGHNSQKAGHKAPAAAKVAESRKARLVTELKPAPTGSNTLGRAVRYLASLSDYERLRIVRYTSQNFDLDRMRTLLKKLGNPHEQFKSVHVAGTKGKGSTCAMVAAMLQASGYKVGLYTSPHLVDVRERIAVNGVMIPSADFARLVRQIEPIVARMKPMPTY